jgi:hypothetical protein
MKQNLYKLGIFFGSLEILFSLDGPHSQSSESLSQNLSLSGVEADRSLTENRPMPVRIPRVFFEKTLVGEFKVQLIPESDFRLSAQGPITWKQQPTTLPMPLPGAEADFRDYTACAHYSETAIDLCFNVMPDVSSVGVNSSEMQLHGIEKYITEELANLADSKGCEYEVKQVKFTQAERKKDQVTIQFAAEAVPLAQCNKQLVNIQLQLFAA